MNFFYYFLIGHLTGDFLLQSNKIVEWKKKYFAGILLHSLIVFLSTLVIFIPYLNHILIWQCLFINFVFHIIIDYFKITYEKKNPQINPFLSFLTDQIAHIVIILFLFFLIPKNLNPYFFTEKWWFEIYQNTHLLFYLSGFLFFSYTFDIMFFIYQLSKNKTNFYSRSYYSMIIRIFLFAILFLLFLMKNYLFIANSV